MIVDRRYHYSDTMFNSRELSNMSAREVAEATVKAAQDVRKIKSMTYVVGVVKSIDSSCKGNNNHQQYAVRKNVLKAQVQELVDGLYSYHIFRRHLVPAVNFAIHQSPCISASRKSKVLAQWREVVGSIDRAA